MSIGKRNFFGNYFPKADVGEWFDLFCRFFNIFLFLKTVFSPILIDIAIRWIFNELTVINKSKMYYVRSIFLEGSDINTDKNNMTKIIIAIKPVIIVLKKIMMAISFSSKKIVWPAHFHEIPLKTEIIQCNHDVVQKNSSKAQVVAWAIYSGFQLIKVEKPCYLRTKWPLQSGMFILADPQFFEYPFSYGVLFELRLLCTKKSYKLLH